MTKDTTNLRRFYDIFTMVLRCFVNYVTDYIQHIHSYTLIAEIFLLLQLCCLRVCFALIQYMLLRINC